MQTTDAVWKKVLITTCPYCKKDQSINYRGVNNYLDVFGLPDRFNTGLSYEHTCESCGETFIIIKSMCN